MGEERRKKKRQVGGRAQKDLSNDEWNNAFPVAYARSYTSIMKHASRYSLARTRFPSLLRIVVF